MIDAAPQDAWRATEAERARLNETFEALCAIESPFGRERACADRVIAELREMGLEVAEDDAGAATGGDTGNLLARIPGPAGAPTILLCAHIDTVEPQAPVEPILVEDGWVNANAGILGADNKAALAVMLELARRFAPGRGANARDAQARGGGPGPDAAYRAPVGIELLFTVSEENALAGAKVFDLGRLTADYGYVFDHATPIGEVITASPTYFRITADFRGRAAHAGIRPEDGRSAIVAAAKAISGMPHGRIDDETTANVGNITGGVGSTNVVAERCRVLAEARSLDAVRVEEVVARIIDALHDGANAAECDVDVDCEKLFSGYRVRPSALPVQVAEAALRACGHEPVRIASGGGSDANVFQLAGFPCVNLANGTERAHEPTERVDVSALEEMLDVAFALLEEAAAARGAHDAAAARREEEAP